MALRLILDMNRTINSTADMQIQSQIQSIQITGDLYLKCLGHYRLKIQRQLIFSKLVTEL